MAKNVWLKRLKDKKLGAKDGELILTAYSIESDLFELEAEQTKEDKVENWLSKITRNCRDILKALFYYQVSMDSLITKMGWKNKHTATNQKHKCLQQIKKIKEKEA